MGRICDMEANGGCVFSTLARGEGANLLAGQPPFIRTAKVELIPVLLCLCAAKDGTKFGELDLTNACQLVEDLLLLELQLLFIWQVLPLATATDAKVLAERFHAYITIFYKAHHLALGKGVLLATDLHVAHITGHAEGYEHHQVVPVEQALAFGCHSLYRHALKER